LLGKKSKRDLPVNTLQPRKSSNALIPLCIRSNSHLPENFAQSVKLKRERKARYRAGFSVFVKGTSYASSFRGAIRRGIHAMTGSNNNRQL
jgi:hypothetical protein